MGYVPFWDWSSRTRYFYNSSTVIPNQTAIDKQKSLIAEISEGLNRLKFFLNSSFFLELTNKGKKNMAHKKYRMSIHLQSEFLATETNAHGLSVDFSELNGQWTFFYDCLKRIKSCWTHQENKCNCFPWIKWFEKWSIDAHLFPQWTYTECPRDFNLAFIWSGVNEHNLSIRIEAVVFENSVKTKKRLNDFFTQRFVVRSWCKLRVALHNPWSKKHKDSEQ